jgi:hypothetical protein
MMPTPVSRCGVRRVSAQTQITTRMMPRYSMSRATPTVRRETAWK